MSLSEGELAKIQGWIGQLNKKIDRDLREFREEVRLKFDRVWREFDVVKGSISKLSDRVEEYNDRTETDIKFLKKRVLRIEEEIESLKN